jgi:hypothetical protein
MGAHNKRLDCTPRVSSEDATSCLQQCARRPAHAHLSGRSSHSPLTRPSPAPHPPLPVAASRLEHGQWLHKSDDGSFSLGIRILLQRMYTSNATAGEA